MTTHQKNPQRGFANPSGPDNEPDKLFVSSKATAKQKRPTSASGTATPGSLGLAPGSSEPDLALELTPAAEPAPATMYTKTDL